MFEIIAPALAIGAAAGFALGLSVRAILSFSAGYKTAQQEHVEELEQLYDEAEAATQQWVEEHERRIAEENYTPDELRAGAVL